MVRLFDVIHQFGQRHGVRVDQWYFVGIGLGVRLAQLLKHGCGSSCWFSHAWARDSLPPQQ
jgi:hypothetical protein